MGIGAFEDRLKGLVKVYCLNSNNSLLSGLKKNLHIYLEILSKWDISFLM